MHESERIVSLSVMSDSLQPYGLWFTRPLCPWNSLGKNTGMDNHSLHFSRVFPDLGIKPRSPALQEDSLLSEPPGKPFHRALHLIHPTEI